MATVNIHCRRLEAASGEHGEQSPQQRHHHPGGGCAPRKEAGFDLSINQKDQDGKHRLYQPTGRHNRHQPQRLKENFLDNKLEASFRSYNWKPEWNKNEKVNPHQKQQVQRRIREKMSSFYIPEYFARNRVFLRGINCKDSDWTVLSAGISRSPAQAVSHAEFRRLISSAADLIVATTSEDDLQHLHKNRSGERLSTSIHVDTPTSYEEHSPYTSSLDQDSHIFSGQSVNLGLQKTQTVPETSENIDYEIAVHATARFQEETTPSLFLRLYGVSGRSITLSLQNPLFNAVTSTIGQAFTFYAKSRDVGELTDMSIGINKKDKACIWYCKKVIVKMGTKQYVFPYNNWLFPCKTIEKHVSGPVSAATRPQTAVIRDMKTCQLTKDNVRPTSTKPQHNKHSSYMVSSKKLEFPHINDGKVETTEKENDHLNSVEINKKKSIQSPRIVEGNSSLKTRKYGLSERRSQGLPSSKKAKVPVSLRKTKTNRETSDQVTSVVDRRTAVRTSDDNKDQSLFSENMYNITSNITDSNIDLTMQDKIQSPKYKRANSPARYVFFAVENKESPIIVQVNGNTKKHTQDGSIGGKTGIMRHVSSENANNGSQCSDEKTYTRFDKGSSELALLQEILLDSGNNLTSGSTESHPFSNYEKSEGTGAQEVSEVYRDLTHISDCDQLCSQLNCEAPNTSGYSCSSGEHSSYETDSTLDEEYMLSDLSLDLSLSEDEDSHSFSKFLNKGPECNQEKHSEVMKKSKHKIWRQRRVESCSENSDIFQHSLSAIHNQDENTLRKLCLSYFFLPSITDEEGKTLLHHAAAQEDSSICQVLLDTNVGLVNIDQQDRFGKTALHYAVQKGNPKIIKILLDNGAKEEIPDKKSQTVLDIALYKVQTQ
ncbi:uncharacterized protein LOC130283909 isoform X3 [Hyla sarda]|uniref:uncharacterized protein LOC130283909 isoform X3 n=1 Tax=Hyla sarda TaxID=327740 RepID=UPI0024C33B00|nr:uncharacterized protein LOC130283909 isoform X3 [Hyla sarda]